MRRVIDNLHPVETVVWPARDTGRSASGGPPPLQQLTHAREFISGKPAPAKAPEPVGPDTAEWEKRIADLERLKQLETAEAHHRGVEDGLRRGREEAAGEVRKAFDQIARALEDLAQTKRKLRHEAERELVMLALGVARRILYRELSSDPGAIEGVVHAALQKLQQREASKVRVWVAGAHAVKAALERTGSRSGIEVVADAGLATGGILFETSAGELDASIETQLMEIQRGFADRLAIR